MNKNETLVHEFDGNSQVNEEKEYVRVLQTVDTVAKYVFILHIIIAVIGFIANILVICRIIKFAKTNPEKYRNGIGILLLTMAIADLVSLITITSQNGLGMVRTEIAEIKLSLCKVSDFQNLFGKCSTYLTIK
jgi:hypothetical protein